MLPDDPGSPEAWLIHAKSDLLLSRITDNDEILLNQLCFLPQEYERAIYLAELVYNWASEFINIKQ